MGIVRNFVFGDPTRGEENISGVYGKELKKPLLKDDDAPFDFIYADQSLSLSREFSQLEDASRTAEEDAGANGEIFMRRYIAPPRKGARLAYARAISFFTVIFFPLLLAQYLVMKIITPIYNKVKSIVLGIFKFVIEAPFITLFVLIILSPWIYGFIKAMFFQ